MHAVTGHAVHLVALHLDDGDIAGIAHGHGLGQALVIAGTGHNVERGGRHLGVQALDDRVAAHDHLGGLFLVAAGVAAVALQLGLVLGVVDAVLRLGRRALTGQALAALAAGALGCALLIGLADSRATAAVGTCHNLCPFGVLNAAPATRSGRLGYR